MLDLIDLTAVSIEWVLYEIATQLGLVWRPIFTRFDYLGIKKPRLVGESRLRKCRESMELAS